MNRFRQSLENARALLDLREHDIERLIAQHDADFMLLLLLIERGDVAAATAIIRRRLA